MKLLVVLSVLAYGCADKLDRTYLPPVSAATAGGSPGALTAPIRSGSGSQQGQLTSGSQIGNLGFTQPGSGFSQGSSGNQPSLNGFISSNNGALNGNGRGTPSATYGVPSESGQSAQSGFVSSQIGSYSGNGQAVDNQGFVQGSGQNEAQRYSPERPQAAADRNAEIVKYINENNIDSYNYSYETSNGISAEEAGEATNGVRAQGAYSYTGDDGKFYSVTYTADENGYQPQGDHLPTPHPIPEEILKSIEENARAAAAGTQEGAYRPEEYESESQQQYGAGSAGPIRPVDQGYGSAQGFQATQGQAINRPQDNQYSVSQGQSGQRFDNGQSGLSGIFKGNAQSGFDNGKTSRVQGQETNGYKYNQPQNVFGSSTLGQGSVDQKQTSYSTSSSSSGNGPTFGSQTQYQAQSNIQYGNQATGQGSSLIPGQNKQFGTNQAAYQQPHRSQSSSGNPQIGSSGVPSQGYQYQPNGNQNTFGSNSAISQGSGNRDGSFNGRGNQNQYGSKQSFGPSNGLGQRTSSTVQSSFQNGNQPTFGTNVQGGRVSGSNASRGSQTLQAPYQYNRPDQSFGNQQQISGNNRSNVSNGKHGSEQFGGPRQPPSFTPESGYKY